MPILQSTFTSTVQADGSRSVHERHMDHNGKTYDIQYFAPESMDVDLVLSERAARLGAEIGLIASGRAAQILGG